MTFDWTSGPLAEGLDLYNSGEYFTAHEAWETVWLVASEPERTFLQALIQVTAAFEHLKRNNNQLGASRLLTAALRRLEPYPPHFGNIDLDLLRTDIRDRLASLSQDSLAVNTSPPAVRILPLSL
jgi:predicted metal-dependent hydrolase